MGLKLICSCIAVVIFITSAGQIQKIRFSSINSGGIVLGQSGSYGMFQTVNGVLYQKWFAGSGVGYDYHYYRSIPLFVDARRYLGKLDNGFIYADIGYNSPHKNIPGPEVSFYTSYRFTGGFYSDIGVGYGINWGKNTVVLITGGYSYKNIRNRITATSSCINPPCPENISHYNYDFNRILVKAGIQLK